MARGLSPLQRTILTLAWQQRPERRQLERSRSEQPYDPGGFPQPRNPWRWPLLRRRLPWRIADIYPQDLYVLHYHWPITYGGCWKDDTETRLLGRAMHFAPAQIGERTYRSVTAAVSRSFHRLDQRGYLTRQGNGWSLTEAGATMAEQLSVK